ncbi:metallophosphoesterase [Streptococcus dentiloxodontae]
MTKLAIMSDLHIDLNQFSDLERTTLIDTLQREQVSHLHLAGDISNHHYKLSLPFLDEMAKHFRVTYNLGNHDMLDLSEQQIAEQDFKIYNLGSKQLLSFHGWYDYSFFPQKTRAENLSFKKKFWFDRRLQRSQSDSNINQNILEKLDQTLEGLDTSKLIVAMHFVPHSHFTMTHERFIPFNAFLGSQAYHDIFVKHHVQNVVFGHAHRSYGDVEIDGVCYHSRPLGYVREWDLTINFVSKHPELNPTGTWNLSKRYNLVKRRSDFQAYKKAELAREFCNSMTLFDLD